MFANRKTGLIDRSERHSWSGNSNLIIAVEHKP